MRVVLQRCKRGAVTVDGETVGAIGRGYVLLVGIQQGDDEAALDYAANNIAGLRLWEDESARMNDSIVELGGDILSVSQFTLYGDVRKGRRPSFTEAARPEVAEPLWEQFNDKLRAHGLRVETGMFGAMMDVSLVNDGPVTILVESKE